MFGENFWLVAALWMGLALVGSLISIRFAISAALVEIVLGVIAGNSIHLQPTPWINFIAGFGSILLTFLAGAEIDPAVLKSKFKESASIGFVSFVFPFAAAWAYAYLVAGWDWRASQICGIALSTTSVAVVYAVMIETGLTKTELGKVILAGCFITDLGTVIALGLLFASFDYWMILFVGALILSLWLVPKFLPEVFRRLGDRTSEPALRALFVIVFLLSGLATLAKSEGVLPAYFLGLAMAGYFIKNHEFSRRLRFMTLGLLTPFYFLKAGTYVSLPAMAHTFVLIMVLLSVKLVAKLVGVWPVCNAFKFGKTESTYTSLLMATGLTFGTISSLYGLTHGIITQDQYTVLVTVVILSAIVPTMIAQAFFRPKIDEPLSLSAVEDIANDLVSPGRG
jgi:Kef-type K+ transport system membrane component KefB